ncbi:MAG: endo-1,4-beta-xylanase [Treponema sp.]|nr:endo-1,4-beta-xylanase [Treponema sp.]MCL2236681.1 endo-1,4-beta-xylanase [Treponema sp.]
MSIGLKDAWKHSFHVGAAVCGKMMNDPEYDALIKKHFSTLTVENGMKFGPVHPEENMYKWDDSDLVANYARKNNMPMRGHVMLWHNQNPSWLFLDNGETVSKNKLYKRLEDHMAEVANRYGDVVYSWDVLNEVIDVDKGDENGFRLSDWYKICGNDVYEFAFKRMREICPKAKLFYNDYNNESGKKMDVSLEFLSRLLDKGVPINGVGIQAHWYYNFPKEEIIVNAIEKYSKLGLEIEFTEVDISIYEWDEKRESSQFFKSRPEERIVKQAETYKNLFRAASTSSAVKNITTWGIADCYTWLDDFPVPKRKNWPLLFDENKKEKPVVGSLIEEGQKRDKK